MTMSCGSWKIFVITSFISLIFKEVSSFSPKSKEVNVNDVFESITYRLILDPNFDESTLGGHLIISATTKRKVSKIVLKKRNYEVTDVYLRLNDDFVSYPSPSLRDEFLVLNLRSSLEKGALFWIIMNFEGAKMNKSPYREENSKLKWLYWMKGPIFPYFDDFSVKSTVDIIFQPQKNYKLLSNSLEISCDTTFSLNKPYSLDSSCFESISIISLQNLVFAMSTFSSRTQRWMGKEITIWSRPNVEKYISFALKILPLVMSNLEEIFGIRYSPSKLDLLAIPDYAPEQIASLGIIALPEYSLLYDESTKSNLDMMRVVKSISKACASMWLQNITTQTPEDKTWFIEGLIRYYEYFLGEKIKPDLKINDEFFMDVLQNTLMEDSKNNVYLNLNSTDFKRVGINKAASILRMTEATIGQREFSKFIQKLFKAKHYQWVNMHDLYTKFDSKKPNQKIGAFKMLSNWFEHEGYPILNVTIKFKNVIISQARFGNKFDKFIWNIPVIMTDIGYKTPKFVYLTKRMSYFVNFWRKNTVLISRDLIPGLYRVNYDSKAWNSIIEVLNSENFKKIKATDRSALLDDIFNLARAGYSDYEKVIEGLKYLRRETEFLPLKTAIKNLQYLIRIFESSRDTNTMNQFLDFITDLFDPIFRNEFSKSKGDQFLHSLLFDFACSIDSHYCLKQVENLWKNKSFITKRSYSRYLGDQQVVTFCAILKNGNASNFEEIVKILKKSTLPSIRLPIFAALGCYRDFFKLEAFLMKNLVAFEKSSLSIYETENLRLIDSILSSSIQGSEFMLNFILKYQKKLASYFKGPQKILDIVSKIGRTYQSSKIIGSIMKLERLFKNSQIKQAFERFIKQMRQEIKISEKIRTKLLKAIIDTTQITTENPTTHSKTTSTSSTMLPISSTTHPSSAVPANSSESHETIFKPDFTNEATSSSSSSSASSEDYPGITIATTTVSEQESTRPLKTSTIQSLPSEISSSLNTEPTTSPFVSSTDSPEYNSESNEIELTTEAIEPMTITTSALTDSSINFQNITNFITSITPGTSSSNFPISENPDIFTTLEISSQPPVTSNINDYTIPPTDKITQPTTIPDSTSAKTSITSQNTANSSTITTSSDQILEIHSSSSQKPNISTTSGSSLNNSSQTPNVPNPVTFTTKISEPTTITNSITIDTSTNSQETANLITSTIPETSSTEKYPESSSNSSGITIKPDTFTTQSTSSEDTSIATTLATSFFNNSSQTSSISNTMPFTNKTTAPTTITSSVITDTSTNSQNTVNLTTSTIPETNSTEKCSESSSNSSDIKNKPDISSSDNPFQTSQIPITTNNPAPTIDQITKPPSVTSSTSADTSASVTWTTSTVISSNNYPESSSDASDIIVITTPNYHQQSTALPDIPVTQSLSTSNPNSLISSSSSSAVFESSSNSNELTHKTTESSTTLNGMNLTSLPSVTQNPTPSFQSSIEPQTSPNLVTTSSWNWVPVNDSYPIDQNTSTTMQYTSPTNSMDASTATEKSSTTLIPSDVSSEFPTSCSPTSTVSFHSKVSLSITMSIFILLFLIVLFVKAFKYK